MLWGLLARPYHRTLDGDRKGGLEKKVTPVCLRRVGLRGGLLARRPRAVSFSVYSGSITYIHKESREQGDRMRFDKMIIR